MRLDITEMYRKMDKEELVRQIEREEDKQMVLAFMIVLAFVIGVVI